MPVEAGDLLRSASGFALVLIRIAGMFVFLPLPGTRSAPPVARIMLAAIVVMLLCALIPTSSMRACDYLSTRLLTGVHPLAVAAALCPPEDYAGYARLFRYDLAHPESRAPGAGESAAWADPAWRDPIERFLDETGAGEDVLARAPAKTDASSKSYCPRCHAPYTVEQGTCRDCGGVVLVPLPPAAT